ncbi:MAG: hypothetical protein V3U80_01305 [Flavobacteriaceae bacterium]
MKKILLLVLFFVYISGYSQKLVWKSSKIESVKKYVKDNKITLDKRTQQYKKGNTIHLFIDENGNHILTGYPTKLHNKNLFIVNLVVSKKSLKKYIFTCNVEGDYSDDLVIENGNAHHNENIRQNTEVKEVFTTKPFAKYGEFTDSLSIDIIKKDGDNEDVIYSKTLSISKTYHISIATGFFVSNLSNPLNIKAGITNTGEATLIADEVESRGIVSLNAVYYPYGRNYMFPKEKFYQNIGILVGTQVDKNQFDNLFSGLQYDFSRGGSIAFGVHYGKVNTLSGLEDFTYGETLFNGDLNTIVKKEWKTGFFVGLNLDVRIFKKLFNL